MHEFDRCPRCAGRLDVEQDSMTGVLWRTYTCRHCGWSEDVNEGSATWKLLHDHNEAREAEAARERGEAPRPPITEESPPPVFGPPVAEPPLATTRRRWLRRIWAAIVLVLLALSVAMLVATLT
jgi:hypothetical protein